MHIKSRIFAFKMRCSRFSIYIYNRKPILSVVDSFIMKIKFKYFGTPGNGIIVADLHLFEKP